VNLKIKKWALSAHAAKRMFERKISVEEISFLLESPEDTISQGSKLILTKTLKGRSDNKVAAVILEKQGDGLWLVITVMVNFQKK